MNIVIAGQKWLAAELLECVETLGHQITAVVAPAQDDRLAMAAQQRGIPSLIHKKVLNDELIPEPVDIILCAHLHAFVTPSARLKAGLGALAYHPSLLPRHRGRDAVRWAIHMREPITGGTVYWMDDGADTGDIALQDWCHIYPDDTPEILWRRDLAPMGLKLFMDVLGKLEKGDAPRKKQNELLATFEPSFSQHRLKNS